MELTFIGVFQLAIGMAIVIGGSLRASFVFLMVSGLFDGSAAIILPALGGSSIPPIQFALLFVYLRMLIPGSGYLRTLPEAIGANLLLVCYTAYGIAAAVVGPRLFAGSLDVVPMRYVATEDLFATVALHPSSQNITAIVYLLGSLLVACAAYQVSLYRGGANSMISAAIAVAWLHVGLGITAALAHDTPIDAYFELFRNGTYAQLDQEIGNFVRIHGLFPESSSFAEFGFAFFVLNTELWYRDIRSRATGAAAIALGAILFLSTSSTAYIGLAGYAAFFVIRFFVLPGMANPAKLGRLAVGTLGLMVLVAFIVLIVPEIGREISDMVLEMTVGKTDSDSGLQRMFWALQGWEAFKGSYGLGIGPGSFRSSSLLMAILGTTGVIGVGLFGAYVFHVYQPTRSSTMGRTENLSFSIGGAFATAALLMLLPAAVSSPRADPGPIFALLAGAALALRPARRRIRQDVVSASLVQGPPAPRRLRHQSEGEMEGAHLE